MGDDSYYSFLHTFVIQVYILGHRGPVVRLPTTVIKLCSVDGSSSFQPLYYNNSHSTFCAPCLCPSKESHFRGKLTLTKVDLNLLLMPEFNSDILLQPVHGAVLVVRTYIYIQTCTIITTNSTFHVLYATAISNTKNITGFIAGTATWMWKTAPFHVH